MGCGVVACSIGVRADFVFGPLGVATSQGPAVEASRRAMIHPLYRWKSFWFGMLVVGFLGWIWVRSMDRLDVVNFGWGASGDYATIRSAAGSVAVMSQSLEFAGSGFWIGCSGAEWLDDEAKWFPSAVERRGNRYGRGAAASYWLLMVLFLIPWSWWLGWHQRRLIRLHTRADESP